MNAKAQKSNLSVIIRNASDLLKIKPSPVSNKSLFSINAVICHKKFIRGGREIYSNNSSLMTLNGRDLSSRSPEFVDKWLRRSPTPDRSDSNTPKKSSPSGKQTRCYKISTMINNIQDLQQKTRMLKQKASKNSVYFKRQFESSNNQNNINSLIKRIRNKIKNTRQELQLK